MNRILYLITLLLVLSSCLNMNDPEQQASYIQVKGMYLDSFVDHLPDKVPNNCLGYTFSWPYNNYGKICLSIVFKSINKYERLKNKALNIGQLFIKSDDKRLIRQNYRYKYPIPNRNDTIILPYYLFQENYSSLDTIIKYTDFEMVVLNYSTDTIISSYDAEKMKRTNNKVNIEYSKGMSFYDNDLIIKYWIINRKI